MSFKVRSGPVVINVQSVRKKSHGRTQTWFRWRARDREGALHEVRRLDREEARKAAQAFADDVRKGIGAPLDAGDVAAFHAGILNLAGTGRSLEVATAEVGKVYRAIGKRATLEELLQFWEQRHTTQAARSWQALVDELLADLEADGASELHRKDVRLRGGRLARGLAGATVGQTTAGQLAEWLAGIKGAPRTRRHYWALVMQLVKFAKRKDYLPKDFDFSARAPKVKVGRIEVYSPQEMRYLLKCAPASLRPLLALGGFAGLRTSEVLVLRWEDVNLEKGHIIVPHETKTGRRQVPLQENAALWLRSMIPPSGRGRVLGFEGWSGVTEAWRRARRKVNAELEREKVSWRLPQRPNALRKSYVSYRCHVADIGTVSKEAGHSPAMLEKHYKELVTEASAAEWFAIQPYDVDGKMVQLSIFGG